MKSYFMYILMFTIILSCACITAFAEPSDIPRTHTCKKCRDTNPNDCDSTECKSIIEVPMPDGWTCHKRYIGCAKVEGVHEVYGPYIQAVCIYTLCE